MSDADATDPVKALREWCAIPPCDWIISIGIRRRNDGTHDHESGRVLQRLIAAAPALLARIEAGEGLRPEVRAFALAMEERLRANDHKPGWKADRPLVLLKRLFEESDELEGAVRDHEEEWDGHVVRAEAADVANFAMMIADVCGGLKTRLGMSPQAKRGKGKSGEGRK